MKKTLIITLTAILLCSYSCENIPFKDVFYTITVKNNSATEIRVHVADEDASNQYPDRKLPLLKPSLQSAKNGQSCYFDSKTRWEENIKKLPKDTLSVYIIDNSVYENEPWDSIRKYDKILKRMDLSVQDLEAVNYLLSYP